MGRNKLATLNFMIAATAIAAATFAGAFGASAADPTQGRINKRTAAAQQQYFQCAKFSQAVYGACLEQAGGNSAKIRSCRSHYQGNLARCRASAGL